MTTFEGFSEAGKLYADNLPLIEQVRAAYEADVMTCLAAIEEGLADAIKPDELKTTVSGKTRYWYIAGEHEAETPRLWTMPLERDFMNHKSVRVVCGFQNDSPKHIAALAALSASIGASTYKKATKWYLFYHNLPLDQENAIEDAVGFLAKTLLAAHAEYLKVNGAP